jgi:hypothetical protein
VRIDESAVRGLAFGPDLIGRQARKHAGGFIMEVDRVTERKRPEISLIVFGPAKSRMDHHGASSADGGFNAVLSHTILMMTANATVFDTLTLFDEKLRAEFLRSVDPVVGAVILDGYTNRGSLALELELGLNGFGASKTNLMNDGDLTTSGITE